MKTILLILALLFAHQSIAVAPYGFKGQDQTATQYSNVLQFPNKSVVKTGGINSLVDTSENLLYNGGFEANNGLIGAASLDGWTCTPTYSNDYTAIPIMGKKSGIITCQDSSACTCVQDFNINSQKQGMSVLLSLLVNAGTTNSALQPKICYRENGVTTSICSGVTQKGMLATEAVVGSSATSIGLSVIVPNDPSALYTHFDEAKMIYGTAVTNQPVLEVQTGRRDFGTSATPVTVTGSLNQTSGQGIYSYNSGTGGYTVLKDGIFNISASTAASITQTNISINISGQISLRDSSNYDASTSAWSGRLTAGQTFSVSLVGGGTSNGVTVSVVGIYTGVAPVYTGRCSNLKDCETVFTADINSGGVVSNETFDWINGNCTSMTGGTCTFNTEYFTVPPVCALAGIRVAGYVSVGIDSVSATGMIISGWKTSTETAVAQGARVICVKSGVDYIKSKTLQQNAALKNYVQTPDTQGKVGFCSAKISATGVISGQLGGCFASCTNATTPICTFTSSFWRNTPNCWATSNDGAVLPGYVASLSTTTFSHTMLNGALNLQAGARTYICHGELQ